MYATAIQVGMPRAVYMAAGTTPEQLSCYVKLLGKGIETSEWTAIFRSLH